jgi:hypothetical protein
MLVVFVARRFQPQVDQSLKVLPHRYAPDPQLLSRIAVTALDGPSCVWQCFTCSTQASPQTSMISSLCTDGKRHECA